MCSPSIDSSTQESSRFRLNRALPASSLPVSGLSMQAGFFYLASILTIAQSIGARSNVNWPVATDVLPVQSSWVV